MNKRTFLKALSAFGLVSLLPNNTFSIVASHKEQSTINGIPVNITEANVSVKQIHNNVRTNIGSISTVTYVTNVMLEIDGRVYHNIFDSLNVKYVDKENIFTAHITGTVCKTEQTINKTRIYLTDCETFEIRSFLQV